MKDRSKGDKPNTTWSGTGKNKPRRSLPHGNTAGPDRPNCCVSSVKPSCNMSKVGIALPSLKWDLRGGKGPKCRESGAKSAASGLVRLLAGKDRSGCKKSGAGSGGPTIAWPMHDKPEPKREKDLGGKLNPRYKRSNTSGRLPRRRHP